MNCSNSRSTHREDVVIHENGNSEPIYKALQLLGE